MAVKRVSPAEAKRLIDEEGYVYVDVRSIPEFDAEHPVGAFNVPLMHQGSSGMVANPDFVPVMKDTFPEDAKLIVGCKSGGRSLRAANVLTQQGYSDVVDQRAGFDAARDSFGAVTEAGWKEAGLPVETGDGGEKSYKNIRKG